MSEPHTLHSLSISSFQALFLSPSRSGQWCIHCLTDDGFDTKRRDCQSAFFFFFFLTISLIFSLNSYCLQMWAFFCLQFASPVPKILNPVLTNQLLTFTDPETPPPGCKAGYSFSNKRVILGSKAGVFQQTQTLLSSVLSAFWNTYYFWQKTKASPNYVIFSTPN